MTSARQRNVTLPVRLPGPWPLWWLALLAALVLVPSALIWAGGSQPVGAIDERTWVSAFVSAFVVGFIAVLDRIAARSFNEFERALGPHDDGPLLAGELTRLPLVLTLGVMAALGVIVTAGYFSDPVESSLLFSRPPLELAIILIDGWIAIGLAGVLVVHTVVQLGTVVRLHRAATAIDILDPGPAHAFARLTSATGIGFVILGVIVVGDPTNGRDSPFYAAEALAIVLFAAVTFALPLWGMHDRLAADKGRLQRSVAERIRTTIGRIHDAVDTNELDHSTALQASLNSLLAERDLVTRLSPWPWSAGTFRGFVSAVMLPIVIWAITRVLEQVV